MFMFVYVGVCVYTNVCVYGHVCHHGNGGGYGRDSMCRDVCGYAYKHLYLCACIYIPVGPIGTCIWV